MTDDIRAHGAHLREHKRLTRRRAAVMHGLAKRERIDEMEHDGHITAADAERYRAAIDTQIEAALSAELASIDARLAELDALLREWSEPLIRAGLSWRADQ